MQQRSFSEKPIGFSRGSVTELEMKERVKELMIEQALDVSNQMLVMDITIIYLQAQRDLLIEQHKGSI